MIACSHRPPCPGCPRFGEPGIAPNAHASLDELARVYKLPKVVVISGSMMGFRHRARLAIRGRLGSPKVGLFELDTHHVVHIPHCSIQHPLINRVASIVRLALVEARVTCYSDKAHLGVARYLQVVIERHSQTAQVVMVANCTDVDPLVPCFELIRERLGSDLHSLWFNSKCDRSNTILGPDFQNYCGPASVVEHFGGTAIHYPPGAFGQNNLDIAQTIIEHVRAQIPEGAQVTEFYAGVGAIGLSVLDRVSALSMNELNLHSLCGLELGLAELDAESRQKATVVPGSAVAACRAARAPVGVTVSMAASAQVVIADPPRKGLDGELATHLSDYPPQQFIYISCGLESFILDAARLTANGTLRLSALTAFNLMPYTEHVETVARFERVETYAAGSPPSNQLSIVNPE